MTGATPMERFAITVWLEKGVLRYRARPGVVNAVILAELATSKSDLERSAAATAPIEDWPAELREHFEERAAIREFDGGLSRADAERAAERECRSAFAEGGA